ncbi:transcriptional repressor [Gammaproteobacteria bacterium]|nr:transcriptional repressor [Gammaproteobacteria bacterium]
MYEAILKKNGLKVTEARLQVLEVLMSTQRHLSADQVNKALEDKGIAALSVATIYRVLTQFHEERLVHKHQFDETAFVYEYADDTHHDHLICQKCGKIDEFFDIEIEKAQIRVAQNRGYELVGHSMVLHGVCHACQK